MRSSMTRPHIITAFTTSRGSSLFTATLAPPFFLHPGEQQKRYPPPVASCLHKPLIDDRHKFLHRGSDLRVGAGDVHSGLMPKLRWDSGETAIPNKGEIK
jgi:hypothetical protein